MTMNRILHVLVTICLAVVPAGALAQAVADAPRLAADTISPAAEDVALRPVAVDSTAALLRFSVLAPVPMNYLGVCAPGLDGLHPWWGGLYGSTWRLHEGFNAQFSLSTSFAFGKGAPRGAGFGQSAAFAYARPLTDRLTVAASIYGQNMDWGAYHLRDVGVGAVVAYKATDRLNLYGYVTHSITPRSDALRRPGLLLSPYDDFARTRVGAMAEWKLGESTTIGVSVEHTRY